MTKYYIMSEHERERFIDQVYLQHVPEPNFMFEIDVIPGFSEEFDKRMLSYNFDIEITIRGAYKNLSVLQRVRIDREMFFRDDNSFFYRLMEEVRRKYIDRIRTMTDAEYEKYIQEVGMRREGERHG